MNLSITPDSAATKIQAAPPAIRQPKNGGKFLLTSSSLHVKAQVDYAGKEKIQMEAQRKERGCFTTIHQEMRLNRVRNTTTADIVFRNTGTYRLRAQAGNRGRWSKWTTFSVNRMVKKPALKQKTSPPVQKPALSGKHALQPAR